MEIPEQILEDMYGEIGIFRPILHAALREMCPKALKTKQQKQMWNQYNPTCQCCYFIAEWLYYDVIGKDKCVPYKIRVPGDPGLHRFVKLKYNDMIIDIAAEQFDNYEEIDYNAAKVCYFMQSGGPGPSKRARELNDIYRRLARPISISGRRII